MTGSRYTYSIPEDTLSRDKDSRSPILDISENGSVVAQIGLNVSHVKNRACMFKSLVGGLREISEPVVRRVLSITNNLMYSDPTISSFTFTRPTRFLVHVRDESIIALLDAESVRHRYDRAREDVVQLNDDYSDSGLVNVASAIAKDPTLYPYVLVTLGLNERPIFHERLAGYFESVVQHRTKLKSARKVIEDLSLRVAELENLGLSTGAVLQALGDLGKNGHLPKRVLSRSALDVLYGITPSPDFDYAYHLPFSRVERLATTLHERANDNYDRSIVTFRVREPLDLFKRRANKANF